MIIVQLDNVQVKVESLCPRADARYRPHLRVSDIRDSRARRESDISIEVSMSGPESDGVYQISTLGKAELPHSMSRSRQKGRGSAMFLLFVCRGQEATFITLTTQVE